VSCRSVQALSADTGIPNPAREGKGKNLQTRFLVCVGLVVLNVFTFLENKKQICNNPRYKCPSPFFAHFMLTYQSINVVSIFWSFVFSFSQVFFLAGAW